MSSEKKNKITKDTIPEGFTVPMALVDLIPVLFFGLSAVKAGTLFQSTFFILGAIICLVSGVVKVLWKLIAAVSKKNIWAMFVQMRILMPIGFAVSIMGLIVDRANYTARAAFNAIVGFPACVFFGIGAVGMVMMTLLAFKTDSSKPEVNWLEQAVNSVAQICIFVGIMLI